MEEMPSSEDADDDVIVLRGYQDDNFSQHMLQYFTNGAVAAEDKKLPANIDEENVCRICLGEEEDVQTNPLFSPCACAGSMGLIHLDCLKEWLRGKKIQRLGQVVSTYFWKNLECELCK